MRLRHAPFACLAAATTVAMLIALAAGCNRQPAASLDQPTQTSRGEAPAVQVVHPEKKNVRRRIERPGYNMEAFEWTPLYAKIAGYVRKWNVDINAFVKKGDVLAELDVPELVKELKQKEEMVLGSNTSAYFRWISSVAFLLTVRRDSYGQQQGHDL